MKRVAVVLLLICLIFSACSKGEEFKQTYRDTLTFTDRSETYVGCISRFESVVYSLKTRVSILETSHNTSIEYEVPGHYYNDDDYILTSFDPFFCEYMEITKNFNEALTQESATSTFESEAKGKGVIFSFENDKYTLKFSSEGSVECWSGEYNKSNDSFRYIYSTELPEGETVVEFIEFVSLSDNSYAIQSKKSRCVIEFDDDGNIIEFVSSTLNNGDYSPVDDSIFDANKAGLTSFKAKVASGNKLRYSQIHIYKDDILTHIDSGSGNLKEVEIDASQYASAFLF